VADIEQDIDEISNARRARIARWVASVGGVGYVPIISGTFGSLPGLAVAILLFRWPWVLAGLAAWGIPLAMWAANHAEREGQKKDPRWVVADETVGMMISLVFVQGPWIIWPAGFVLFRLFDIVKPYPVGRAERLPGGVGIVMDDVLAGLYTNLILQILMAGYVMSGFASVWGG
jgi:phosphatidylglycerophosphatase A